MADLPIGAQMQQYPIDEMLSSLAKGLVKAQWELNQSAVEALRVAAAETVTTPAGDMTLAELGLAPSFYRFDELMIDLSIEMSMYQEEEAALAVGVGVEAGTENEKGTSVSFGASVDIAMSRKYGVDASAATRLSAIISAIDPPKALLNAFGIAETE